MKKYRLWYWMGKGIEDCLMSEMGCIVEHHDFIEDEIIEKGIEQLKRQGVTLDPDKLDSVEVEEYVEF